MEVLELAESDYLYIKKSQLKNAGKGLFTSIAIFREEEIAVFKGEILSERQITLRVNKGKADYFISMLDGTIMDCERTESFAKYANDAQGFSNSNFKNNCRITIDEKGYVCLEATKKIKAGEEIFCSYGKQYWTEKKKALM